MASAQHYVWAAGHFLLLVCASKYLLAWITFQSVGQSKLYSLSYTGALVSYAIVCFKSFSSGVPTSVNALQKAALDENIQYFGLALFWWFSKPVPVSLIPFATFSLFHALTFLRSNILPQFFPPTPAAAAGQPATQHPLLKRLQAFIKANYDPAMRVVAYAELLIFVRVVLGAITWQNSLLTPIIYMHFLRLRFYMSKFTQRAIGHVSSLIDGYARQPSTPPAILQVWEKIQLLVSRWAGVILTPQQPANPNPNPNAARR